MHLTPRRSFAWPSLCLATLAACSARESKTASTARADSIVSALKKLADTTNPYMRPVAHQYGPPTGKIRVANLRDVDGQPGGPIDVYDVRRPDSTMVPLIKALPYGQVSAYISPRAGDNCAGCRSNLYIFPAGAKTATQPFGGNIDNSGFQTADQITIALGPSRGFGGAPSIAMIAVAEAGPRVYMSGGVDSARVIPAGKALLISRAANDNADSLPELYLTVDGTCPHATNDHRVMGDTVSFNRSPSTVGPDLFYPVAPGTHTLAIVTSMRGHGLLTCTGTTPGQASTVSITPGQRAVVFVYGVTRDGFKAVAAPIAGP